MHSSSLTAENIVASGILPETAIKLTVNEFLREEFEDSTGSIQLHHEIIAGGMAGLCKVVATNPTELVKIRCQMQASLPPSQQQSITAIIKEILTEQSITGMYRGLSATLLRDVPFCFIFFPLYAKLTEAFADARTGKSSTVGQLIAGSIAGGVASAAVTPADVVKTRLQMKGGMEQYGSIMSCVRTIVRKETTRVLFAGVVPRVVLVSPLFGITVMAFELQKDFIRNRGMT
jgi:solute carrier family 25 (mitochondrial aspartate/glutamate transporter), member 12/13